MENSDEMMMMAKARRRRAEAESAPKVLDPEGGGGFFDQHVDENGQSYMKGVHFGPVYASEEDKIKAMKQGGIAEVAKQSLRDTGNMVAAPINMLTQGADSMMKGIITAPLNVVDSVAGTNMGDKAAKWLPEYRSPGALQNVGANIIQYAAPTKAAVGATGAAVANLPKAAQYMSKMAAALGTMFGVTDPSSATTLGDVVGGPTEIKPEDSGTMKRTKVAAEGGVINSAVDVAAKAIPAGVGKLARAWLGPEEPHEAQDILAAFDRQKVEAPAAAVADNPNLSNVDNALSNLPTSAKRMQAQKNRVIGEDAPLPGMKSMPQRVEELVGGKSASEIDAGNAIQAGSDESITKFKADAKTKFDSFDAKVASDTKIGTNNIRSMLSNLQENPDARAIAERTSNPALKSLIDDVTQVSQGSTKEVPTGLFDAQGAALTKTVTTAGKDGSISYEAAKVLRDRVGAAIGDPALLGDIPRGELKRLYGALSKDIEDGLRQKSPALVKEFQDNNKFYLEGTANIERTAGKYAGKDKAGEFKKTPEQVYRETMGGQTSAERATQWRALRNTLHPDKWEVVQAEEIRNLGKPNSSSTANFSVQTYLKKWNDLTPAEKDVLFSGGKYAGMRNDLEDLAKISDSLAKVKGFRNTSNTAPQGWFMHLLSGGVGAAFATTSIKGATAIAGATGVPYAAGRVMTSPGFVKWLADGSKAAAKDPAIIPGHIARLVGVANQEKDPETKKEILNYKAQAEQELKKNPPAAAPVKKPGDQSSIAPTTRINPKLVAAIGKLESNDNPAAVGKGSSAQGSHQFTDGTWQRMVNKYGRAAGIGINDRGDAKKSAFMANKYAEENYDSLKERVGRAPTDAEVYMAHVLGAGGAARVIKEYKSGKTAAEILPDAAKVSGNKALFYKGDKAKTVAEFYADMARKLAAA